MPTDRLQRPHLLHALALAVIGVSLVACAAPAGAEDDPPIKQLPRAAVDLPKPAPGGASQTAYLAGGCFWCEEAVFEQLKGVSAVVAGYAGGTQDTANYEHYTESNHAETVKITYDPAVISFTELIRVLLTAGDPTTKDGQFPDFGHQYRMAVFYADDDQKRIAAAYLAQLEAAKSYDKPLAVTVEPMPHGFFPAEDYHQHYVSQHPDHPYCRRYSFAKIRAVRRAFADELKPIEDAPGGAAASAAASTGR